MLALAEGRRIQPDMSDSTLSTLGGLGLEDLATFVRQSSEGRGEGQEQQQQQQQQQQQRQQDESFAGLVVRSVTASALQRSTSSLLKVSTGNGLSPVNDGSREKLDRAGVGERSGHPEHTTPGFSDDDAMQTTVARKVGKRVETTRSTTATAREMASTEGEAKELEEAGKTMDVEEIVSIPKQSVLPQNESFSGLVVRSVTASALQRSTSSLLKTSTGDGLSPVNDGSTEKLSRAGVGERRENPEHATPGFGDDDEMQTTVVRKVEKRVETTRSTTATTREMASAEGGDKELEEAGETMDVEEMVCFPKQGVLPQNESFAELVVRSVTASALQRSTSSLLKISTGDGLSPVNDSSREKLGRAGVGERRGHPKHATPGFSDDDEMQTTVARKVEKRVETTRSKNATTRTKTSAKGGAKELEEAGKTVRANDSTNPIGGENLGDGARHTNTGEEAEGGKDFQVDGIGDATNRAIGGIDRTGSSKEGRSGSDEYDENKSTFDARNVKQCRGEEDGNQEDHVYEYSSDSFEEEDDAENCSGSSSSSSSESGHRGNQRRRPPQPGHALIAAILTAAPSSSDRHAVPEVASTKPYAPTPPKALRLEKSENNNASNVGSADARIVGVKDESTSRDLALRCDQSGTSASTRGTGAGQNEPVSLDTFPASQEGNATLSRPTTPAATTTAQDFAGGKLASRAAPMPSETFFGLASLNCAISTWFSAECLATASATATSALVNKRREQSSNVILSTSKPTGDIVGVNFTAPEAHRQREPEIATVGEPIGSSSGNQLLEMHPARLFHLLWQRDRSRCPFSSPIPETICFDSTGTAVDWFFTSKIDGGIKRKLTSNTRLSNIFQEFSKGSKAETDPVAVLVSWRQKEAASSSPPLSCTGDAAVERPKEQQQRRAAIVHLTTRELHAFLFGASQDCRPLPPVTSSIPAAAAAARGWKRRRTENAMRKETLKSTLGPRVCHGGGVEIFDGGPTKGHTKCFSRNLTERSEAAAVAAGKEEGDGNGGDWCLLQKFVGPAGNRSSTLRCHWTRPPSSSHPPAAAGPQQQHWTERHQDPPISTAAKASQHRWGSFKEVDTSFRERSPDRSPYRNRPEGQHRTPGWRDSQRPPPTAKKAVAETAGLELGAAERIPVSGGVHAGCLLERSTNVFRAGRTELSCEDRCVTFEEPSPSSRGGLWPRSVLEPIRSCALRETLVETCTAVSDHVSEVTKGAFRPKEATGYFRQGPDGRTYLMFFSHWGQNPPGETAPCDLLLARTHGTPANERSREDQQDFSRRQGEPPLEWIGRERNPARTRGGGEDKRGQQDSGPGAEGLLVCPGCGRSGVRGGVRCTGGGGTETNDGEQQVEENDAIQAAFPTNRLNQSTLMGGTAAAGLTTGDRTRMPREHSTPRPSPADRSLSTDCVVAGRTFHTSLGVVVDVCTWRQQGDAKAVRAVRGDGEGEKDKFPPRCVTAITIARPERGLKASAGVTRCLRVLARLHPGVSAETLDERCAQDLRLRLKGVRVCRSCALEIADASDERLRQVDGVLSTKAGELSSCLGPTDNRQLLSERQRKARIADDIKAFRERLRSAKLRTTAAQARSRDRGGYGGEASRMGDSATQQGYLPRRPLNKKIGDRPSTTDGVSPTQQAFNHSARKVVSAKTPSSGHALVNSGHEGESMATATAGADDSFVNDGGKGNPSSTVVSLPWAGSNGGGGDDFGDALADSTMGGVTAHSGHQVNAASGQDGNQATASHEYRLQTTRAVSTSRSFYDPSEIALRCRRLCYAYGGSGDGDGVWSSLSPRRTDIIRHTKSAAPMREGGHHHPQHRPSSDASRKRRVPQSARVPRPSSTKPPTNSSSKALQWAKAVGAKTAVGRGSDRHPRSASCSPQRHGSGPGTAGSLGQGGEGTAATNVGGGIRENEGRHECGSRSKAADGGCRAGGGADPSQANRGSRLGDSGGHVAHHADGRGHLGRGDNSARTNESRDTTGAYWAHGVDSDGNKYSADEEDYSNDSFATDGDNDGECRNGHSRSESRSKFRLGGQLSDFEYNAVDAIPSTLVETGREAT